MKRLYKATATPTTVILRSPERGEKHIMDTNSIIRKSRGGDILGYNGSTDWFDSNKRQYSFRAISESVKDDFIAFVEDVVGVTFTLADWNGVAESNILTGIFDVENIKVVHNRDGCNWSISFAFLEE